MLVSMWMSREVVAVPPTMPVAQVGAELARRGVRRLPVVEQGPRGGHLVGIVSIMDLTRAFPPDVNPLSPMASERGPQQPICAPGWISSCRTSGANVPSHSILFLPRGGGVSAAGPRPHGSPPARQCSIHDCGPPQPTRIPLDPRMPWRHFKSSSTILRTLAFSRYSCSEAWECQSQRRCRSLGRPC
jgi:CBS domain protein